MQVSVIGGGVCSEEVCLMAEDLGRKIGERGYVLICGGRGGVMEAACRGAVETGGLTVGILPGDRRGANPYLDVVVETGMGHARNAIVAGSGDVVVALPGEEGTLSEMALALKMGKRVISLGSWNIPGVKSVKTVDEVMRALEDSSRRQTETVR